jgi:hypothetical protein
MISEDLRVEALKTICAILENGDRLTEDAENLFEMDRLSSACSLHFGTRRIRESVSCASCAG